MTESEFFSHVTSAVIWDLPLPPLLVDADDVDVAVLAPRRNPRGRGVRGHEIEPKLVKVVTHPGTGLRVASPASTWALLGSMLPDPYDLVAAGDGALRAPWHPAQPAALTTATRLSSAVSAGRRVGVVALRDALPLLRTRSASRPESWMRRILVDAGLPEPELNVPVFDENGRFIGFVDQAYPDVKVAVEYEGEHHLHDPAQWRRDIARYEQLAQAGWFVIRATKHDIFTAQRPFVSRVRRAVQGGQR